MVDSPLEPEPPPPHPRFTILGCIGRGSMGAVYRARDAETELDVALKSLPSRSPEDLYRLKREFRVLADTVHPNLVELYELFVDEHHSFFTMELLEGREFTDHVRADGRCDLDKLAPSASQLVTAVAALHASGRLHRDLKPSNALVTPEGRVVVLDFGLATALELDAPKHYALSGGGSIAYLAPEVLFGEAPGPEADWYAVGVLLYEALTGKLPFPDTVLLGNRLSEAPLAASAVNPAVPAEWSDAVAQLLHPRPGARARAVAALSDRRAARPSAELSTWSQASFVGRRHELAELRRADARARTGTTQVVHLVGPSGIGKSAVVREFVEGLWRDATDDSPVVLVGRCHPSESIPHNAFDGVVDSLSRHLLAAETAPPILDADALVQLFPVLGRVYPAHDAIVLEEPHEQRRRSIAALKSLLTRIGSDANLVLWIDDLQWSDQDSLKLLREILQPPAPRMLLLLSYRDDGASSAAEVESLAVAQAVVLKLDPLDDVETQRLVRAVAASSVSEVDLGRLVAETAGNAFLAHELGQALARGSLATGIDGLLRQRVGELPVAARHLLEMVSVAGGPLRADLALDATGLSARGRPLIRHLEKRALLRSAHASAGIVVETYHDRIREALLEALPADATTRCHAALAEVHERQDDPDADALYRHSLGAGRREVAGRWAEVAADRAGAALAFDHAARMYAEACELAPDQTVRWALREKRGRALANGGRGFEAAQAYQLAAQEAGGAGAAIRRVLECRQRAATHFVQTGHLEEGIAMTSSVLRDVGVTYPSTQGQAMWMACRNRARLGWRGMNFQVSSEALPDALRLRLDACWGASISMVMVDQAAADALGVRHLLDSLDSGDALQIARALGAEASRTAQIGGRFMRRRCARLIETMSAVVVKYGGPYERAYLHVVRGMQAVQSATWRVAQIEFDAAEAILRRDCVGVSWEMVTIQLFGLSALAHLGELRRLNERLPAAIGDAADRGDIYASLLFHTGAVNLAWLARDEADEAIAVAEAALASWPATDAFQVQHYVHLMATVNAEIYRGDGWAAFRRMQGAWPRLRRALFLTFEGARVELRNLRARAALAAAVLPARSAVVDGWPRARLLALAESEARRLGRERDVVSARAFAELLHAGVARARGAASAALTRYEQAEAEFRGIEMNAYAAASAAARSQLETGSRAESHLGLGRARAWAEAQSVMRPEGLYRVFAPS